MINKRKKISGRYRRRNNKLLYNAYGDVGMAINLKLIGITDGRAIFSCVPAVFLCACDTRSVNRYLRNCKSRIETLAVFILICNLKRSFYRICMVIFPSIYANATNGFEFRSKRHPATLCSVFKNLGIVHKHENFKSETINCQFIVNGGVIN